VASCTTRQFLQGTLYYRTIANCANWQLLQFGRAFDDIMELVSESAQYIFIINIKTCTAGQAPGLKTRFLANLSGTYEKKWSDGGREWA
jgi:hypothetical protein